MLRLNSVFLVLLGAILSVSSAGAVSPSESDARKIMEAAHARDTGDKATGRMRMVIIDKSGSQRERSVRTQGMDFPGGTKQLILFESPADVRNTGLLTVDYDDGAKVDDQWLYLPSLRKSTRIASSKKSGAFMGSDISFADMTRQEPSQFDYTMVKADGTLAKEAVWVIEARPRTTKAKEETGYVKSRIWMSKDKLMPLQAKHWVREGKKLKYMKFSKIKKVNGIWVAHKLMARTKQSKETLSTTVLTFSDMVFGDPSVKKDNFTQRSLEKGL